VIATLGKSYSKAENSLGCYSFQDKRVPTSGIFQCSTSIMYHT